MKKCSDCGREIEIGEICLKCRLERLKQKWFKDGRVKKSNPAPIELQLPPSDRE